MHYPHCHIRDLQRILYKTLIYSHNLNPSIEEITKCNNIIQTITSKNAPSRWTFIILEYRLQHNPYIDITPEEHSTMSDKMIECMQNININTSFIFNFQNNNSAIFIYFKNKKKLLYMSKDTLKYTKTTKNCTLYKNILNFCSNNEIDCEHIGVVDSNSFHCTDSLSKAIEFICRYLSDNDEREKTIHKVTNSNTQLPDIITSTLPGLYETNATTLPNIISQTIAQTIECNTDNFTNCRS